MNDHSPFGKTGGIRRAWQRLRCWLGERGQILAVWLTPAPATAARISRVLFWAVLAVGGWIG
ncbi:MAG: hypothetical protein EA418_01605, partial [Wenzhouxiangellaceae bacterium]